MRQLRWGLKAEFPYTKVFILGILLTVLGSACVVVTVIGIIKLAWGYYVGTGMWGGAFITISGLAAMYSARSHSSASARLYFLLSVATCVISFAMLVLSAGGLTYKSDFYRPVRFDSERHKVTLFLHGSVLGISVLSLACNLLSVIVCCKFMTREKERPESIKLRRHRRRRSDSSSSRRNSSLRGGSGATRASANSRTPLFNSETARKHKRQNSGSDVSTTLKIPTERHRRDSDRSRGSSRSRHSHHRQPSSASQQSPQSGAGEPEVTIALLRESSQPNARSGHQDGMSSHVIRDNVRDSLADSVVDSISQHLVFDPDEEPPPPYEERRPTGDSINTNSTGDETDTETVVGSSNIVVPSYLPLNIPVTQIGGQVQMESLQRQPPPPSGPRSSSQQGRDSSAISNPSMSSELLDNCVSLMRMALTDDREEDDESQPQSEERAHSPEICALTGARLTPVAAIQPDTVGSNTNALLSCVQPSPGSSETSIPGGEVSQLLAGQVPVSSRSQSMPVQSLSSTSPSALPGGIRSPNSAFRPVGKGMMPSSSVPLHNFFSPISAMSAPGSPHHTVYSPLVSANPTRLASNPTSPHHSSSLAPSSSDSLRGGNTQSSLWKKIPLPTSHNQSNKTSTAPTKEVISKNIPGPAQPVSREGDKNKDNAFQSLPRQSSKEAADSQSLEIRARTQFSSLPTRTTSPKREPGFQFATIPARNVKEAAPAIASLDRHHVSRRSGEGKTGSRQKSGAVANPSATVGDGFATLSKQSGAVANPDLRNLPAPADPVCRSAGIQATDDGGISSSMDRTHRWVLGTLPSGTRYQGVTRNIAHAHLTSSQGPRAATLGAVRDHGVRVQGSWNRPGPQVESSTLPSRSHASQPRYEHMDRKRENQRDSSFSSPKRSSGPVAPKPVRPNPGESTGSSAFSSPAKSHPVAPKAVRPLPADNSVSSTSPFSSPAKPQPIAPKPIKPSAPLSNNSEGSKAFSSPAKTHPLANSLTKLGEGESKEPGAFSSPVKSQSLAPNLIKPETFGNGSGAFSSPGKAQPIAPKPVKLGEGKSGAFSSPAKSQLSSFEAIIGDPKINGTSAFSSLSKSQPMAPKPVKLGENGGAFSSLSDTRPQPLAPKPIRPTGNGVTVGSAGSMLTPVSSHPLAPKPGEMIGNGTGAFSSPARSTQLVSTQPVSSKLTDQIGNGSGGAFSAFSSISAVPSQPLAPKPVKPVPAERSSKSVFTPVANSSASSGSSSQPACMKPIPVSMPPSTVTKGAALSPSSRLPRYQPGRQNSTEESGTPQRAFQPPQQQRQQEPQVPQPQEQPLCPQPLQPQQHHLQSQQQLHHQPQAQHQPQPQQPQPQQPQPQVRQAPVIPPRAPPQPQPQPVQRQRPAQPLQPHRLPPGQALAAQNQNQPQEKPLFSVLL